MEKQYGGVFHRASNPVPSGLYWYDAVSGAGNAHTTSLSPVFETLVTYPFTQQGTDFAADASMGKLHPLLAESWRQVKLTTYEFTLRKGMKWHDGEEFTSKDVIWSLERWGDSKARSDNKTFASNVGRVEAIDRYGVRITLKEPDLTVLVKLADHFMKILPAHIAERAGNPPESELSALYSANVIGTGPFRFRSFDRAKSTDLERFDGYWGGRPHADGIRTFYGMDSSTQNAAFIAQQLDFHIASDKVQFDTVAAAVPGLQKIAYFNYTLPGVYLNLQRKPFDDVRVRRAVHLGLDRQELRQTVTFGEGAFTPPPPIIYNLAATGVGLRPDEYLKLPGWRQPKDQDRAEAKRLLAEAGYPNGLKATLKYRAGAATPGKFAEPVAGQLKSIGLDVTVQPVEDAVYVAQVERDRNYEIVTHGLGGGLLPADEAFNTWHSAGNWNVSGINDPEVDRLIEQARQEIDEGKRNDLFIRIQRIMIQNVYYVPLVTLASYQVLHPWVHEFYGNFGGTVGLFNTGALWLEVDKMPEGRRRFP